MATVQKFFIQMLFNCLSLVSAEYIFEICLNSFLNQLPIRVENAFLYMAMESDVARVSSKNTTANNGSMVTSICFQC